MARSEPAPPAPQLTDPSVRVLLLVAGFHRGIAESLVAGARARLAQSGLPEDHVDEHWVPGSFELPLAAQAFAASGRYGAILCLGAVIRGETSHFDYVCSATAQGLLRVGLDTGVPCTFGVLTCETFAQALARSGGEVGNKGEEASDAAVAMMNLLALAR